MTQSLLTNHGQWSSRSQTFYHVIHTPRRRAFGPITGEKAGAFNMSALGRRFITDIRDTVYAVMEEAFQK